MGGQFYQLPIGRCWLLWNKIIRNWSSSEHELAWSNLDKPNRGFDYSHGQLATEGKCWHPTQKPVPLMMWCIKMAGDDVKTIIDPCMGSGSTLVAAKRLGLSAVGIEINAEYCEAAVTRLQQNFFDFD
jgi:site-specific DNA-methyltransferase (adenine-specific)